MAPLELGRSNSADHRLPRPTSENDTLLVGEPTVRALRRVRDEEEDDKSPEDGEGAGEEVPVEREKGSAMSKEIRGTKRVEQGGRRMRDKCGDGE